MSMQRQSIQHALRATVAYFDLFDHPLTLIECWQYLICPFGPVTLEEVANCLEEGVEGLSRQGAFFVRTQREHICETRLSRYLIADRKYCAALRFARIASLIPSIQMIAVCNTLAMSASRDESDIDFFIVAKHGSLWFARAFCGLLALMCGSRPSDGRTKDTYCLSFFVSDNHLDLSPIALEKKSPEQDIYLVQWVSACVPLFDRDGTYDAFWHANAWAASMVPNRIPYRTNRLRRIDHGLLASGVRHVMEIAYSPLKGLLECMARAVQWKAFPRHLRIAAQSESSDVIIHDSMLKFHFNDQRANIRKRWKDAL